MSETSIQTGGKLFELVQMLRLFGDSKAFTDSLPLLAAETIQAEFEAFLEGFWASHLEARPQEGADRVDALLALDETHPARVDLTEALKPWVLARFRMQSRSMEEHIEAMWTVLERRSPEPPAGSTLISLPGPYLVAGGRYVESYYWDSYFTCLGLAVGGHHERLHDIVDNFASLIERFGYIPNGTRTYYLGRSQPPFFTSLVQLLELCAGESAGAEYAEAIAHEYAFWMDPAGGHCLVVEGSALNRYWDSNDTPRQEGYWEDVQTAHEAGVEGPARAQLYRDLRAAAESGWDFSSRWIAPDPDGQYRLAHIHTTEILPVDLNALLYRQERYLASAARRRGDESAASDYAAKAAARKAALLAHFWDSEAGWFFDFDHAAGQRTPVWSLAGMAPLYCGLLDMDTPAERAMAEPARQNLVARFLRRGGVVSTLLRTGQQWDEPNGWAPLQWMAAIGLLTCGYESDAREIAARFSGLARRVHTETGKMMEKYDVCEPERPGGGGEYPNQEGFGWTNGVVAAFLDLLAAGPDSLAAKLTQ